MEFKYKRIIDGGFSSTPDKIENKTASIKDHCCRELYNEIDDHISLDDQTKENEEPKIYIRAYEEYDDGFEPIDINFCPFCGEAFSFKQIETAKQICVKKKVERCVCEYKEIPVE